MLENNSAADSSLPIHARFKNGGVAHDSILKVGNYVVCDQVNKDYCTVFIEAKALLRIEAGCMTQY